MLLTSPLQVFLTPGHQPSGLRRLRADGDRVQYLPGGGAATRLFHHSAQTGLDHHGEGTSVFMMRFVLSPVPRSEQRCMTSCQRPLLSIYIPNEPSFRKVSGQQLLPFFLPRKYMEAVTWTLVAYKDQPWPAAKKSAVPCLAGLHARLPLQQPLLQIPE